MAAEASGGGGGTAAATAGLSILQTILQEKLRREAEERQAIRDLQMEARARQQAALQTQLGAAGQAQGQRQTALNSLLSGFRSALA